MRKVLLQAIIFISAFLLFQIELIMGKVLLMNYGGSYFVWGACVVFFQACLVVGYQYSQWVLQRIGIKKYRYFHAVLILCPLLSFPGHVLPLRYPIHSIPLVFDVAWQLAVTIGLVFFVLSTTSIIYQSWLSASSLPERTNPYTLFAVSNLGSFVALFSYPAVFELIFDFHVQQNIWRVLYGVLVVLQLLALKILDVREDETSRQPSAVVIEKTQFFSWLLYSAAGVMVFLSVTNIVSQEIAPMPLLWVIPLAIYLLSFVLNFKSRPYCPPWIESKIHLFIGAAVLLYFVMKIQTVPVLLELIAIFALTFFLCMFVQRKLYLQRPIEQQSLPYYYSVMAWGGFLGGLLVSWVIPVIAVSLVEYLAALVIISIGLLPEEKNLKCWWPFLFIIPVVVLLIAWPLIFSPYGFLNILLLLGILMILFAQLYKNRVALTVCLIIVMGLVDFIEPLWGRMQVIYQHRNFYGIGKVYDDHGVRYFLHGTTIHGSQYLDIRRSFIPMLYYSLSGPLGETLTSKSFQFKDIGILGLGIGAISSYASRSQNIDYYELDPDVLYMARKYFLHLDESAGNIRFIFGDGRLSLAKAPTEKYDLLVMDAFSGDSIPVHLLTVEALEIYHRTLKKDGVMIFHLSNRFVYSAFGLCRAADFLGAKVVYKEIRGVDSTSTWVSVTWDANTFKKLLSLGWQAVHTAKLQKYRVWTDEYSTILPYLRLKELLWVVQTFHYWKM